MGFLYFIGMGGLGSRSLKKKRNDERKPIRARAKAEPKRSWAAKMKRKEDLKRVKDLSKELKTQLQEEAERARASRRANRERKAENEKKSMVTQTIKNVKAIKKLSPKQRRKA